MEQLWIGVPSIKIPYFKDPMRFLFWTFLDILKMSIFGFLKIIFFYALKNLETKLFGISALKMVRKTKVGFLDFLRILEKDPLKLDIFKCRCS